MSRPLLPLEWMTTDELRELICRAGWLNLEEIDGCNPDAHWSVICRQALREWGRRQVTTPTQVAHSIEALSYVRPALEAGE